MSSWSQPLIFAQAKVVQIVARACENTAPARNPIDAQRRSETCEAIDTDQD